MVTLRSPGGFELRATPYGPTPSDFADVQRTLERGVLRSHLRGGRYRWLNLRPVFDAKASPRPSVEDFAGTLYNYATDLTIHVTGQFDRLDRADVTVSAEQPIPSPEEFEAAVEILRRHHRYGPALSGERVVPYTPMPPLQMAELGDGRSNRVVTVGLYAGTTRRRGKPVVPLGTRLHELVGVNLSTGEVGTAGPTAAESSADCGGPTSDTCPLDPAVGFAEFTVTAPDGSEVWRLTAVRPRHSSNTALTGSGVGSGIDLLGIDYRGRRALAQAHVPILNVEYQDSSQSCGPAYRDWLNEESCFEAFGTDVAPGIRVCDEPPRTILENGVDGGNFRGAAAFFEGNDLLLVSEMNAGWYRYISSYRFRSNGTIEPRFGFSAVANFCTCQLHVHHAYWRFDFDVEEAGNNRIEEFNDPEVPSGGIIPDPIPEGALGASEDGWMTMLFEKSRFRDSARSRRWGVSNTGSGAHYQVQPGHEDGTADEFGGADAWLLRYHDLEAGDYQGFTEDPLFARQRIDLWANSEPIDDQDVVFWYAGHLDHSSEVHPEGGYLGPDLVCSWAEDISPPTTTTSSTTTTSTTSSTTTTVPGPGGGGGGGGGGTGGGGSGGGGSGGGSGGGGGGQP